ncbi:MAG: hypothetical protein RL338_1631, partial [Chloroflexota bacterium]
MSDPGAPRPIVPADLPRILDALERTVRARSDIRPRVGIVLGSGLAALAEAIEDPLAIPFRE